METTHQRLHAIYKKHQSKRRGNPDSNQMCCMWSTNNPPDTLIGTRPISDIEKEFKIELSEDDACLIYDMDVDKAAIRIGELQSAVGR